MIHSQPAAANLVGQFDAWKQILETLTERLSGYQCLYPLLLMLTPPSSG